MAEAAPEKKDVVPTAYREKYKETGGTNGDFIATALSKIGENGIDSLNQVKAENGIEAARWSTFNHGMQRMNLANVLRGQYLKGGTIKLLGREYNIKHQSEDFNGTVTDDAKVLDRLAGFLELNVSDRTRAALQKLFFPAAPKGKTAEQRAADKAAKDATKAAGKALKTATADAAKARTAADKAKGAADKASAAVEAAKDAVNKLPETTADATDEQKAAATKAKTKAVDKLGNLEDKAAAAADKHEAAVKAVEEADAKVAELTPAA